MGYNLLINGVFWGYPGTSKNGPIFICLRAARSSQSRKRPVGAGLVWAGILEDGVEVPVDYLEDHPRYCK